MFNEEVIRNKFQAIGSDVVFNPLVRSEPNPRFRQIFRMGENRNQDVPLTVDVIKAKGGKEIFKIDYFKNDNFDLSVLDTKAKDRHLLLMVKNYKNEKIKLLCGHDERHFFSCGIPGGNVSTVEDAKKSLLPSEFLDVHKKKKKSNRDLLKRKNRTGRRQGEWIFVKEENFNLPNGAMILKNEPISRGQGSKPHICEELYREGGETVYVHPKYAPNGMSEGEMNQFRQKMKKEKLSRVNFDIRKRNAKVYVRGDIKHGDHKTVHLPCWHRVVMNTENQSKASQFSVFLD